MRSNYKPLGEYIQEVNDRNTELNGGELLGVSIQKIMIPSIANTVGTDMSTYKLIKKNQFAYGPVTSRNGDKISVALYEDNEAAMISQAYTSFEVKDEKQLLPEYLMMWFRRSEFDRYARFKSHGSAREIFDWDEMCNTLLPVPHPDKQKEIVAEYNTIQNRIALNQQLIQKLEETAQAIYKQWFVEGIDSENLPDGWKFGTVSDLCHYSTKRISLEHLNENTYISTKNMFQDRGGVFPATNLPSATNVTNFESGNVLISNIRPYFKKIWLATFNGGCSNDVLCLVPKANIPSLYLYQIVEKDSFFEYVMAGSKGTKMPRGDRKWIMNYPSVIPSPLLMDKFNNVVKTIQTDISVRREENKKLFELKDLLLAKLATE